MIASVSILLLFPEINKYGKHIFSAGPSPLLNLLDNLLPGLLISGGRNTGLQPSQSTARRTFTAAFLFLPYLFSFFSRRRCLLPSVSFCRLALPQSVPLLYLLLY